MTADPTYQPGEVEASPRVRAAFSDVRRRLLPDIASSRYGDAKAIFDRKEYVVAAQRFRQVVMLLDDPDRGGKLADLRTLVSGFLDLSVAASAPPPEPLKPVVAAPPPVFSRPDPNRVYNLQDRDVTPPTAIRQDMPRFTPMMKLQAKERGVVEIVIDEQGRVTFISVRQSVHPMFDSEMVTLGKEWRYQPAMLAGKPVRYRKMIQINIKREE